MVGLAGSEEHRGATSFPGGPKIPAEPSHPGHRKETMPCLLAPWEVAPVFCAYFGAQVVVQGVWRGMASSGGHRSDRQRAAAHTKLAALFLGIKALRGIPGWSFRLLSLRFLLPISPLYGSPGKPCFQGA